MYRFKDMRPHGQRSSELGSEASGSASLPLPSTTPYRYLPRRILPRAMTRCCLRVIFGFLVGFAIIVFHHGTSMFSWPRWSRSHALDPHAQCEWPMVADTRLRPNEFKNAFAGYQHFGEKCRISSLELHRPYDPLCRDRASMLKAMSSGGRVGRDAPYVPRGCDMQWYTTQEVCEILGRFSQVILVGDSMLRHVIGALNIIIREDLGFGGVTNWNFNARERAQCFCNDQFDVTDCSVQGIYKTADVIKNEPWSLACPRLVDGWSTDLRMEQMVRYPMEAVELERLEKAIEKNPSAPQAFILGHGLWNDLELDTSKAWLDTVVGIINAKLRLRLRMKKLRQAGNMSVLLMTPNAAGAKKPDAYLVSQGNKALVRFEHAMADEARRLKIDHLGTWNMSVQANLYDGVHMDMRGNLLKAMMVVNWLNLLDT